jgi:hypothetical protein
MADESMMHHAHLDHAMRNRGAVIVSSHGRSKRRCHELHAAQHKASMSGITRTGEGEPRIKEDKEGQGQGTQKEKEELATGDGGEGWRRKRGRYGPNRHVRALLTGHVRTSGPGLRSRHRSQKHFSRLLTTT